MSHHYLRAPSFSSRGPFFSTPHRARLVKGQHDLTTTLRAVKRAGR